jgi:two-component system sensor kinase FixL
MPPFRVEAQDFISAGISTAGESNPLNESSPSFSAMQHAFDALLDAAVDAVIVIDHRGRMQAFNRAAERLFGYGAAEALGRNVSMLMPDPDRSAHDGYLERYLVSGEAHIIGIGREVLARRKDGSVFPASLAVGRMEGENPPRFVGFIRDLTTSKQAEAEVQSAQERLSRYDRLGIMGAMASGLAHEMNQPLAAISTYAQAARRLLQTCSGDNLADIDEALGEITSQALRAGDVIQWLRSFAKSPDDGHGPVDCNRMIEDLLPLARMRAARHGMRIALDLATRLPPVSGNATELQQVILNLVNNGIDAMAGTSDVLPEVVIGTRTVNGRVEICVSDHGPGISAEVANRMFDPFFTTKENGTGLGLAISSSIVRAHGGVLQHRPALEGGACFFFTLPVVEANRP